MDPNLVSAMAAVLGSLVGGSATMATAWLTQRTSTRSGRIGEEMRKREALYGEFIAECSKLVIDSLDHGLEKPEGMCPAYASLNLIRLTASDPVLAEAEKVLKRITGQYFMPNMTLEEIGAMTRSLEADPLRSFSEACRAELKLIGAGR